LGTKKETQPAKVTHVRWRRCGKKKKVQTFPAPTVKLWDYEKKKPIGQGSGHGKGRQNLGVKAGVS